MMRFIFLLVALSLSFSVNLSDNMLARLGLDSDILMATLAAFIISGLIVNRHLAIILLTVMMSVGANLPAEMAEQIGYNPDYLIVGLIMLVLTPYIIKVLR